MGFWNILNFCFLEDFCLFAQTVRALAAIFLRAYQSPAPSGGNAAFSLLCMQACSKLDAMPMEVHSSSPDR
jgi:hypothetical protein